MFLVLCVRFCVAPLIRAVVIAKVVIVAVSIALICCRVAVFVIFLGVNCSSCCLCSGFSFFSFTPCLSNSVRFSFDITVITSVRRLLGLAVRAGGLATIVILPRAANDTRDARRTRASTPDGGVALNKPRKHKTNTAGLTCDPTSFSRCLRAHSAAALRDFREELSEAASLISSAPSSSSTLSASLTSSFSSSSLEPIPAFTARIC